MPKIYQDATLSLIWDMVHEEQLTMKKICKELCCEMPALNQMYKAAYRRYGCNQHSNRKRQDGPKKIHQQPSCTSLERPPAVYSNRNVLAEYEQLS